MEDHTLISSESYSVKQPVYLYVPISRLIVMSILSCGIYEIYWIYKNWRYLKEPDHRYIKPFWRAWFSAFLFVLEEIGFFSGGLRCPVRLVPYLH